MILFGSGYFRFAPDGSMLDYVARTSNNTWGVGISEDNYVFGSTANRNASNFVHIPGRYYRELIVGPPQEATPTLPTIADRQDVYPLRNIYQVDQFGMYTAGSAHEVYTARAFPREYWNRMAFVAEPTAHVVGMFALDQDGSAFEATNRWNLVASRDAWQAPVQVKVGPDGAVWISDFYSLVAQHNPTPEGTELGEGNAYETPNRDKIHGRIYRVVWEGAPATSRTTLAGATPAQLVQALRDDNMFWRMTAQRLLVQRGQTDVVPALIEMARDQTVDEIGLNPGALHALWTLEGLGAITTVPAAREAARLALHHPSASMRRAALQILPRDAQLLDDIFRAGILPERASPHEVDYTVASSILQDADPQVRLTALLALSELPPSERAANAIIEMITIPQNARDRWLPEAAAMAGAQQGSNVAVALLQRDIPVAAQPAGRGGQGGGRGGFQRDTSYAGGLANTVRLMAHHFSAKQDVSSVIAILRVLPTANPTLANAAIFGIAGMGEPAEGQGNRGRRGPQGGWPEEAPPTLTAEQRTALAEVGRAASPELREGLARVAARWGMPDLFQ